MEDKLAFKRRLYQECLKLQRNSVQRVRDVMKEAQESALADDENSEELFDSYREQMQHTREMYASQLQTAQNELDVLERVPANDLSQVIESGAVVRTDNQNFFVAISLAKIELDGKTYFPISTSSPIFQAMVGLKQGATFQFRDRKFNIKEVF
jgi:transcription elongation GreA/GreB family factor